MNYKPEEVSCRSEMVLSFQRTSIFCDTLADNCLICSSQFKYSSIYIPKKCVCVKFALSYCHSRLYLHLPAYKSFVENRL